MRLSDAIWFRIIDVLFIFVGLPQSIKVLEHTAHSFVIKSDYRKLVVDRKNATIARSGRVLARFADIQSIDLARLDGGVDYPTTWRINLFLSQSFRVRVGASTDELEASVAAAHLSTITGRKVVARVGRALTER
jgi:hypothetical protein